MTAPARTWYKPEFSNEATHHTCYCHKPAWGRTQYWNGTQAVYKYQCREHLPAEPVVAAAVPA